MTIFGWLAAIILLMHLEIPGYWLVLHPSIRFWAGRHKMAYVAGALVGWGIPIVILVAYRRALFAREAPGAWKMAAGIALLVVEAAIFWRVRQDLGLMRLVGKTELGGGGEVVRQGIYAYIRHPRYTGSACAVAGACLLGGTRWMWALAGGWAALTALVIHLEERELRRRFGGTYEEYARSVPRFFPRGRVRE